MLNLKRTLDHLGLSQKELARLIDVNPRTVSTWSTGSAPTPGPVSAYLRVLQMAGPKAVEMELRTLQDRARELDEGLYCLTYRATGEEAGSSFAVLRNGKIFGSDREGGVFSGSYEFDQTSATNRVHIRFSVPAGGALVTGFSAGPQGATLDIMGAFQRASPVSTVSIEVEGQPLEVELSYLGPLPN